MSLRSSVLRLCACAVLVAGFGSAAAQTGGLSVVVEDATGPLPGAIVELTSDRGKVAASAVTTDAEGRARFPVLMPGDGYRVRASFPGYGARRVEDLKVPIGSVFEVRIVLAAELEERVRTTASPEVVDLDRQESATRFDDRFIQDLPVQGRFYENILTLAPGVQDANDDGNPNVHGSRARDFKAMVGGIANVDPFTGQKLANVNPNAIDEIEIITAGAGPEYGRAQGGYANLILKQGNNDLEGVVEWLYRDSRLDKMGALEVDRRLMPEFSWSQPSAQLTGPILKDQLWFRLSHERIEREDPLLIASGIALATTDQRIVSDQITWQASPRNKIALRYDSNPVELGNFGLTAFKLAEATENRAFRTKTGSLTWDAPISPRTYVRSIVAYQDSGLEISPSTADAPNRCILGAAFITAAHCFDADTGLTSGSYWLNHRDDRQRFTVRSDATYYAPRKFLGAEHILRFGGIVENERYVQDESRSTDILTELSPRDPFRKTLLITANISVPFADRTQAKGVHWGAYVRDTIKPLPNLAIDLGVRVGRESIFSNGLSAFDPWEELRQFNDLLAAGEFPIAARNASFTGYGGIGDFRTGLAEVLGVSASQAVSFFGPLTSQGSFLTKFRRPEDLNLRNTNVSPYVAIAWDPWNDGKTKIAATAGRHYNNIPLNVPAVELQTPRVSLGLLGFRLPSGRFFIPAISGATGSLNPAATVMTVDHDLRTPYQDEITATIERELWNESSLRVMYVKRSYRDQLQDFDLNRRPGDLGTCVRPVIPGQPSILPVPDGELDDCVGLELPFEDPEDGVYQAPDGILDIYALNPFWGSIFRIGNLNRADYEGVVTEFIRRQFRGWEMQASYTWSVSRGDGEDFQQEVGNEPFNIEQEYGFQSSDQRHVVKVLAAANTRWGFRVGGSAIWQTGLPYSVLVRESTVD